MSIFAKRRDSDEIVTGLTSTNPPTETGYSVEDTTFRFPSDFATETWHYDSVNTYTKISDYREEPDYSPRENSLSGSVVLDFQRITLFERKIIVTGNITFDPPINFQTTQTVSLWLIQDGTGSHSISFDSSFFKLRSGTSFNIGANDRNFIQFIQDNGIFYEVNFVNNWI